jgi:hypothetical protein
MNSYKILPVYITGTYNRIHFSEYNNLPESTEVIRKKQYKAESCMLRLELEVKVGIGLKIVRWTVFLIGMIIFCLGIALTIRMQHLGIHPWDVLNVGLYQHVGLSIGSWAVIISFILIAVSFVLDKSYLRVGTFFNAVLVGVFVDFYLWLDILPAASHSWTDILMIVLGIVLMRIGGGIYNAADVGGRAAGWIYADNCRQNGCIDQ